MIYVVEHFYEGGLRAFKSVKSAFDAVPGATKFYGRLITSNRSLAESQVRNGQSVIVEVDGHDAARIHRLEVEK